MRLNIRKSSLRFLQKYFRKEIQIRFSTLQTVRICLDKQHFLMLSENNLQDLT